MCTHVLHQRHNRHQFGSHKKFAYCTHNGYRIFAMRCNNVFKYCSFYPTIGNSHTYYGEICTNFGKLPFVYNTLNVGNINIFNVANKRLGDNTMVIHVCTKTDDDIYICQVWKNLTPSNIQKKGVFWGSFEFHHPCMCCYMEGMCLTMDSPWTPTTSKTTVFSIINSFNSGLNAFNVNTYSSKYSDFKPWVDYLAWDAVVSVTGFVIYFDILKSYRSIQYREIIEIIQGTNICCLYF